LDKGRAIHNVGPDPARSVRGTLYEMERGTITGRGYQNYFSGGG